MTSDKCPKCKTSWEEEETIFEYFLNKKDYPLEEALAAAEMYGCTPENPNHFSKDVVGIEIQGEYDGVSIWQCKKCLTEFDRWSMKEIKKD